MVVNRSKGVRIRALVLTAALALFGTMSPTAVLASPAPPPPLDACLALPMFELGFAECRGHSPAWGNQFGSIASVVVVPVQRGVPITLGAPGGADIDFDPPHGQCGENGCPRVAIIWRPEFSFSSGLAFLDGCKATDITCRVSYLPPEIGDEAEHYMVVYAEEYLGIQPTGNSRAFALYTPPTVYPVRLYTLDTDGRALAGVMGEVAYAVREGATATQSDCLAWNWYDAFASAAKFPMPACITLRPWDWGPWGGEPGGYFGGDLPNDSGTWTVVAQPGGDPAAPLLERPAGYRRGIVTPAGDDIRTTIVKEPRPELKLEVRPETTTMEIGTTQTVEVVVKAIGGEAGSLTGLYFGGFDDGPGILHVEGAGLEVVGAIETIPREGFSLRMDQSRVFQIQVRAVGLGEDRINATVIGRDDLGKFQVASQGRPILVEYIPPEGEDAPVPPVIDRAADLSTDATDPIEGSVEGAPNTTVVVTLATSSALGDGACARLMSGNRVARLGSFRVDIGADGIGRFSRQGALTPGSFVYGIMSDGGGFSAVGECAPVAVDTPSVRIDDVAGAEGNGKGATTPLTFTVTLSSPSEKTVSVDVQTADGSAKAPSDYVAVPPTTLTFAPGEVSNEVAVKVVRDTKGEPDEEFLVDLSNAVNATIVPADATGLAGQGIGTIVDDDDAGSGGPVSAFDVRGKWTSTPVPGGDPGIVLTLVIKTQDPGTGALTGVIKAPGAVISVTGSVSGDTMVLKFRQAGRSIKGQFVGTLVMRGGTLTATGIGSDSRGVKEKERFTLVEPLGK